MPTSKTAPGFPGIAPTWTSSAKDIVSTALGSSRLWVTLGHGVLNEVYWPSTGTPQLRDLGFIVATPEGWHEVKRIADYEISLAAPYVPLPAIRHRGPGYELALRIVPDPMRDAVLIAFQLIGKNAKLYVLAAPHLGHGGHGNNAHAAHNPTAWKDAVALRLVGE